MSKAIRECKRSTFDEGGAKSRDARYDYLYSKQSLQKVKDKIERMASEADVSFVAANNHPRGQAAANAIELKSLLSGEKVSAPETLLKTYPELDEFSIPKKADDLPSLSNINSQPTPRGTQSRKNRKSKASEEQQDLPL